MNRTGTAPAALFVTAILTACSFSPSNPPLAPNPAPTLSAAITGARKIKHVVFVIQEGRSFDTLFEGYPNADTVARGRLSSGTTVKLRPISLAADYALPDDLINMLEDCNGTGTLPGTSCQMNGFNFESSGSEDGIEYPAYVYVDHKETSPYFAMAHRWVLADNTFASQLDGSFTANQYLIAAQARAAVNYPTTNWGCPGGSSDEVYTITKERSLGPPIPLCWSIDTLGDEMDEAGLSWAYYASTVNGDGGNWSAYQNIEPVYNGPDWAKDVISPQTNFLRDVNDGKLRDVSWVAPTCENSDKAGCGDNTGPAWVASLVNAVGESKYWDSATIFVLWSDWGGFYDHVPPEYLSYDSLGFRVPLLVISPYAKRDYVSHVQYETTSVLRFAEDLFGLRQLSRADRRATSPAADCFDFSQKPRKFVPIKAPQDPLHRRVA